MHLLVPAFCSGGLTQISQGYDVTGRDRSKALSGLADNTSFPLAGSIDSVGQYQTRQSIEMMRQDSIIHVTSLQKLGLV